MEYLLKSLTGASWANVNTTDPENVITQVNEPQVQAILETFKSVNGTGAKAALELHVTASYWLGVPTTST